MSFEPHVILASGSPRRKELLTLLQLPFIVKPTGCDESQCEGETPLAYVQRVAAAKGDSIPLKPGQAILSADTIVIFENKIIGKPKNDDDARHILKSLRGKTHKVITAAQLRLADQKIFRHCETNVTMRGYSDEEIDAYIARGEAADKAGAYAIQDPIFHPVARFDACHANIMGLCVCQIRAMLRQAGIATHEDLSETCQRYLGHPCPLALVEKLEA